jgi:ABC-type multidrug transport system permease subunit
MSAISAILYREGKIRATNIIFVFWDFFYPLCYLLVFGVGMSAALGAPVSIPGVDYNAFFLGGVLGMASFGIASNSSWSFFMDRDNGIFYEMLTYPMSRSEYLLGKVAFNLFIALAQAAITLLLGSWLLGIRIRYDLFPILFIAIIFGTSGWFFFYTIFALRIRRNDIFNGLTSVLYFVFLLASSLFYPVDPLPRGFRIAALANPITWEVDLLRYGTIGYGHPHTLILEAAAFTAFAAACFIIAVRSLNAE